MTVEKRKPYIYCHTCGQQLCQQNLDLDEMLITSPEEAEIACAETGSYYKTLRCENLHCVAPNRAIIMYRTAEPTIISHLKSWVPVATFCLRYDDDNLSVDQRYSIALFSIDKTRRTPDISFGDCMDIDLLCRSLDGFAWESRGAMTVFDYFCWRQQDRSTDSMAIPIETFHSQENMVPTRYNPFCAAARRHIHTAAIAEVNARLSRGPCEFLKSSDPAAPVYPNRKPSCTKCLIESSGSVNNACASNSASWHKCWLYFRVCRDISPCYQSDCRHFGCLLSDIEGQDLRNVIRQWQSQPEKHASQCWAGFWEILIPIVMHNHLVAFAMGGQVLRVRNSPPNHASGALASIKSSALAAAATIPCLSSPSVLKDLATSFKYSSWIKDESQQECKWILNDDAFYEKARTLASNALLIQRDVSERYLKKRRVQEDCFHDELCARLDLGIEAQLVQPLLALPPIIQRMREFWAFQDVLYLSYSEDTNNVYSFMVDSSIVSPLVSHNILIPTIKLHSGQVPPLGIMINGDGSNLQERTPGCEWIETIRALEQHRQWPQINDLVIFIMPTNFGHDLFIFHSRDTNEISFKPCSNRPSDACAESIRRTCSSLVKYLSVATEKKHLEERLRAAKAETEDYARDVLERVRSITASAMANIIKHDIRTALQTLLSPLDALASYSAVRRQSKALDDINKAMNDISDLSRRLDHLSKYYSTTGEESLVGQYEPSVLVDRAVGFCSSRCKREKVEVVKQYALPLPFVECQEIETVEIIYNLLTNAIKAMRGATLKKITVAVKVADKHRVRIEVTDTGRGMTRDEREQLFYPVTSTSGGSGLGLFTCKELVNKMRGSIACKETAIGRGSTFVLELNAAWKKHK